MSDGRADGRATKKASAKSSKKTDDGAMLLNQWRHWMGLDSQTPVSFDEIRKYLVHLVHALDNKVPLRELPARLAPISAHLEAAHTESELSATTPSRGESPTPRQGDAHFEPTAAGIKGTLPLNASRKEPAAVSSPAGHGETAQLKKALDKIAAHVESLDAHRHWMTGRQNETRDALSGLDARLASIQESVHPENLANANAARLGNIERRLSLIETSLTDTIAKLGTSFTFEDAVRIGQLRRDLEREVGPNIRNDISKLLAPIIGSFDELVASNRLDETNMRGIINALRERATKAGLTMDPKRVL